ncbi:hypothetical protein DPMN_194949 [Dreissena polymorpha]|uniref:Uncharacterized protein n=1 Tax=Dreissena polymorpha TaxID=45954 RepID=A0A9D4BEE9_DREPO|nr:hypothetical protein DPMN_194949 [Dreissena polymorpha]
MTTCSSKKAYNSRKTFTKTSQPNASVTADTDRNLLTESAGNLYRWTDDDCSDLYNYPLRLDPSLLQNNPRQKTKARPYLTQGGGNIVYS